MTRARSGHAQRRIQPVERGITLIELLVAVLVLGVLTAVAIPSFRTLANTNRVAALTNELVGALNYARSEAIKRGVPVTVCKTANPHVASPTCATSGGWQTGWLVFTDGGTRGTVDGNDARLRVKQPIDGNVTIEGGSDNNFGKYITYFPAGNSRGGSLANGTFTVCAGGLKRDVKVSDTGRIRIEQGMC